MAARWPANPVRQPAADGAHALGAAAASCRDPGVQEMVTL